MSLVGAILGKDEIVNGDADGLLVGDRDGISDGDKDVVSCAVVFESKQMALPLTPFNVLEHSTSSHWRSALFCILTQAIVPATLGC